MEELKQIGKKAKDASKILASVGSKEKNNILTLCAAAISENMDAIIKANGIDIQNAEQNGMKPALIDRLMLNEQRIEMICSAMLDITKLNDPIGEVLYMKKMENGLTIGKKRVPMGVIGIIYESRPNVTADAFALCLKAGSSVILKGGKDAIQSNKEMVAIIRNCLLENQFPQDFIQLIENNAREVTNAFMQLNEYLDLLIPRGGSALIQAVVKNATVPVIETGTGNCHVFVDETADLLKAVDIIINGKVQRPGTCNSTEKVLVHKQIAEKFLPPLEKALNEHTVEIRADELTAKLIPSALIAGEEDWYTEFLDLIIGIKIVNNIEEAIYYINKYSSHHSESILTNSYENSQKFLNEVDSAAVYVNASTRFTDGFEFGLGAEIGISTQKLHARGPMGLNEITSTKYIVYGNGQIRS